MYVRSVKNKISQLSETLFIIYYTSWNYDCVVQNSRELRRLFLKFRYRESTADQPRSVILSLYLFFHLCLLSSLWLLCLKAEFLNLWFLFRWLPHVIFPWEHGPTDSQHFILDRQLHAHTGAFTLLLSCWIAWIRRAIHKTSPSLKHRNSYGTTM